MMDIFCPSRDYGIIGILRLRNRSSHVVWQNCKITPQTGAQEVPGGHRPKFNDLLWERELIGCWWRCIWSWADGPGWCRGLWGRSGPWARGPAWPSETACRSFRWSCWLWWHETPTQCYENSVEAHENRFFEKMCFFYSTTQIKNIYKAAIPNMLALVWMRWECGASVWCWHLLVPPHVTFSESLQNNHNVWRYDFSTYSRISQSPITEPENGNSP